MNTRLSRLGALSIAGGLALGATSAFAADETAMARDAKVTIAQAIEAAEQKGAGKATEAEFDDDGGAHWTVKVLSATGDKLTEYRVDAVGGQVTGEENQPIEKYFTRLTPASFQKASTQLKDAIAAAETLAAGKAIDAEVESSGESVAYEIDVATADGSKKDVSVDANGKAVID